MNLFTLDALATLTAVNSNCVSIYLPTEKMGIETQKNPIRFKNLIREAEEKLIAYGLKGQEARDLLQPAQELDNYDFWQHQGDGLAMFIADNL